MRGASAAPPLPPLSAHLPPPNHLAVGGNLHGDEVGLAGVGASEVPARVSRQDEGSVARRGDALEGVVSARPVL